MIKSMTGYGKASAEINNKKITVEIKTLNSKQSDISIRIPSIYKENELIIRSIINQSLERGKIEFSLGFEISTENQSSSINKESFKKYFNELSELAFELNQPTTDLFSIACRNPEIFKSEKEEIDENEWDSIEKIIKEAISATDKFRKDEGKVLENELQGRIKNIMDLIVLVEQHEPKRIETVKERILQSLKENIGVDNINKDRFEQELIYYIEKFDITEEKIRLRTHCNYFIETMNSPESEGKKLGFITQEIGREINTMGSKANHVDIQKIVVQMKDELEKIKEQTFNVL
ncbi:MAG: YicC family protein [Flavobacteriales bacterium]|nr:YicC family protein [Flavobacteriales bacterium]